MRSGVCEAEDVKGSLVYLAVSFTMKTLSLDSCAGHTGVCVCERDRERENWNVFLYLYSFYQQSQNFLVIEDILAVPHNFKGLLECSDLILWFDFIIRVLSGVRGLVVMVLLKVRT